MKTLSLFIVSLFISFTLLAQTPEKKEKSYPKVPSVELKDVKGNTINTSKISNDGKPVIISFWALWCKPCQKELTAISEVWDDWVKETGVKLYAVSIDDSRSSSKVKPTAEGKGWEFEILLDVNSDFKRAMNVNMIPHTFILNGKGEIVWQHTSFADGGELELIKVVKKIIAGEDVSMEK
ncbi:MAG: TlpA disulfide reductase family protein [Bacteroidota bacterium]